MLLNLWDNDKLIQEFMELYNLTNTQICNILKRLHFDAEQDNVNVFCEETGIKLDKVDIASELELLGKIVSTTIDDFNCLKRVGLVTLDTLLENDSPMSQHLKKYHIEVKPSTHELFYYGKRLHVPFYNENCKWCVYGDKQCRYSKYKYKNMYCPYLEAISPLAIKLYKDNSEIEMFIVSSEEDMLEYSTVKEYPEIFATIEDFIYEWFGEKLYIGNEWAGIKQYSYIVTVPIKYDDMSYRNRYTCGIDGEDANNIYWKYEKFLHKDYDYTEQVPKCFWDNVWLINICLDLICPFKEISESICAGIKRNIVIPYDRLKIDII